VIRNFASSFDGEFLVINIGVYSCVLLLFISRRPTTQKKTFGPGHGPGHGPGRICNSKSGPGRIWKNHIRCNLIFARTETECAHSI